MKQFSYKVIVLAIIPFFVFASLTCCCFGGSAQAQEPVSSCHGTTESSSQSSHSSSTAQDCDCTYKDNFLVQKNAPTAALSVKSFFQIDDGLHLNSIIHKTFQISSITLAYQGPPETFRYSLPIYLQNSNLRI